MPSIRLSACTGEHASLDCSATTLPQAVLATGATAAILLSISRTRPWMHSAGVEHHVCTDGCDVHPGGHDAHHQHGVVHRRTEQRGLGGHDQCAAPGHRPGGLGPRGLSDTLPCAVLGGSCGKSGVSVVDAPIKWGVPFTLQDLNLYSMNLAYPLLGWSQFPWWYAASPKQVQQPSAH